MQPQNIDCSTSQLLQNCLNHSVLKMISELRSHVNRHIFRSVRETDQHISHIDNKSDYSDTLLCVCCLQELTNQQSGWCQRWTPFFTFLLLSDAQLTNKEKNKQINDKNLLILQVRPHSSAFLTVFTVLFVRVCVCVRSSWLRPLQGVFCRWEGPALQDPLLPPSWWDTHAHTHTQAELFQPSD